jgi:hypothetical protein
MSINELTSPQRRKLSRIARHGGSLRGDEYVACHCEQCEDLRKELLHSLESDRYYVRRAYLAKAS